MYTAGASTPPTLDGFHLIGASADTWEVTETELVGTIRMANGATREQRLAPEPGAPVIRRWYGVTLDYRHLGPLAEEVEARLAFPGPTGVPRLAGRVRRRRRRRTRHTGRSCGRNAGCAGCDGAPRGMSVPSGVALQAEPRPMARVGIEPRSLRQPLGSIRRSRERRRGEPPGA